MRQADRRAFWIFIGIGLAAAGIAPAGAQVLGSGGARGGEPITIDAEEGIEWRQNEFVFIARGNARAVRADGTVKADELKAYYREGSKSGSDIWRLDAVGNVEMTSPGTHAFGETGVYDVENSILVLKGMPARPARFVSGEEEVSATGQLEFWDQKQIAVARGGARAVQVETARSGAKGAAKTTRELFADVLVAHLKKGADGKDEVERIEAFDAVKIVTAKETITADRGTYETAGGTATLVGRVKITRDGNTLEGCRAQVDTRAGISRLFACGTEPGGGGGRVKGTLVPKKETPSPGGKDPGGKGK